MPKNGCEKIKKDLKYVEELKKLTYLQIENIKNNLIKIKNKRIKIIKKADREYYEYEENKFYGSKGIRNLFNENDDYDVYKGIDYSFKKNAFEYEEIKKLLSVKSKQEYVLLLRE